MRALWLRKTRGQRYTTAGEFGRDLTEVCRAYSPPRGWQVFKEYLATLFQGGSSRRGADQRLLSAILRKRIGMAMDRDIDPDELIPPGKRRRSDDD